MLDNKIMDQMFYPYGKNLLVSIPGQVIVKLHPYRSYNLNKDSYKTLAAIQEGASLRELAGRLGLTTEDELANLHKFLEMALRAEILTTDAKNKGILRVKSNCTHPPLERVFIEVTDRCNLKCAHCYMSASSEISGEQLLTLDELKDIIKKADEMGVYRMDFTGGELFFRDDISAILQAAADAFMITNIFTNGTMLDQKRVEYLAALGNIRVVFISLDDIIADEHDDFRGVKGSFNRTVEGIRLLKAAGMRVVVNITISKRNYERLDQIIRFCKDDLDVQYRIAPIVYVGRGTCFADDDLSLEQIAQAMKNVLGEGDKLTAGYCDDGDNFYEKNIPGCGVGHKMIYIRSNGEICLCPTLSSREDPGFLLGRIGHNDLQRVWEEAEVLNRFRDTYCKHQECERLAICRGGCRSRAFLQNGDLFAPDPVICSYFGIAERS